MCLVYKVSQKKTFLNCRFAKPGLRICDFHCLLSSQLAVEDHVPSNPVTQKGNSESAFFSGHPAYKSLTLGSQEYQGVMVDI